jgi:serine/threonine protein kinase
MTQPTSDRNLLFGILALEMKFISREALLAAMQAWVFDQAKTLGAILVEQQALSDHRHGLLDALVQERLAEHDNDAARSLAALGPLGPIRQELERIADAGLHASLAHVPPVRPAEDPYATRGPAVGTATSSGLRFRILRPHARGGMGEVLIARDEELHREVALKQIQERLADDPQSRARFVVEAEITGALEHPAIVPVYGLGAYPDGRPYYAMRFVQGDSLTEAIGRFYQAEGPRRDPGERAVAFRKLLGRFIDVCNAIEYAHSRGVLHRDLKPGNILLGKYGETLVVDWGLAKALEGSPPLRGGPSEDRRGAAGYSPGLTQAGSAIGTPAYMSPEQAAGRLDQLGTACDVYGLGATLYFLLTGQAPFADRPERGVGEILQRVQRGDFPPPRKINGRAPAALEAVCAKAMALEPEARYASPRALADDVEHWLADEPVSAHREPVRARLGRWARRHRVLVASAAVLLVTAVAALTAGLVLLGRKQAEVVQQRNAARRARDQAEAINKFLVDDLLGAARPEGLGRDVLMRTVLDRAARQVETSFPDQPEVEAAVRLAIGDSYRSLSLYEQAEPHLRRALELRREHLGPDDPETLQAIDSLVVMLSYWNRKLAEAEILGRDNLEARRQVLGSEHPDTLTSLQTRAYLCQIQGKHVKADRLYRECLEAKQRVLGLEHPSTLYTAFLLAQNLYQSGKLDEAGRLLSKVLEAHRRVLGPEHPQTLYSLNDLALVRQDQNKLDDAEQLFRQTLEIGSRVWGAQHQETLTVIDNLAVLLGTRGKLDEAERLQRRALEGRQRVLGIENPQTLTSLGNLAVLLQNQAKLPEAEKLFRDELRLRRKLLPAGDPNLAPTLVGLGDVLTRLNRAREAEPLLREAVQIRRKALAKGDWRTANAESVLGACLLALGRHEEAEPLLLASYRTMKTAKGTPSRRLREALDRLIKFSEALDRPDEVKKWRAQRKE